MALSVLHIAKMTGVAGTENHLLALLPGLRAEGLDVRLIVLCEPDKPMEPYMAQMSARGVPTEPLIIRRDLDVALIGALRGQLRALKPHIVHTHLIHADWHGAAAARLADVRRVISSLHNDDPFRRKPHINLVQRLFWRQAEAGIAISEAVRQFTHNVEGAPLRKLHTIRYGYDPTPVAADLRARLRAEWAIPPNAPLFGSVCRLVPQKGLFDALEAMAVVLRQWQDVHYVIVGDGPLRAALEEQAARLGIGAHVHFGGWRADGAAAMHAFDFFLMPSHWEGFGLVVLEAMAARLPVVATAVSALPEIVIDGETGRLAPPHDPAQLAAQMSAMLGDHQRGLAAGMGQAGYARLRAEFSVSKMVRATAALYDHRRGSD